MPEWASGQVVEPFTWPAEFNGAVQTEIGTPISGAKVKLEVSVQLWVVGGLYQKTVYETTTESDDSGRYQFTTDEFPEVSHRPIVVFVTASTPVHVPWRIWTWYGPLDREAGPKSGTIKLAKGRVVTGQCVGRDKKPAANAQLSGTFWSDAPGSWADSQHRADGEGRFRFLAPKGAAINFWVSYQGAAPRTAQLEPGHNILDGLYFDRGTAVEGVLLSPEGDPCPGVIVAAQSSDSCVRGAYAPFRTATRTDAEGRFTLPRLNGEYRIFTTSAARLGGPVDGVGLESDTEAPYVIPVWKAFGADESSRLMLKSVGTVKISGTVTYEDGEPVGKATVRVSQMPRGNGTSLDIARALTNQNGQYRIEVASGIERLLVYVEDSRRRGKQSMRASVKSSSDAHARIDRASGDETVDFVFRP